MKNFKQFFLVLVLLFVSATTFAMVQDVPEVDLSNTNVIIGILTPLVTLVVTWLAKKVIPAITGVGTLVVVPVVAGLFTLVTNSMMDGMQWYWQLLLGLVAVFLHQFYDQLSESNDPGNE